MGLRVAIDVRRIGDFGIGTHIRNLVHALDRLDHENHYLLVTNEPATPALAALGENFERVHFNPPGHRLVRRAAFAWFLRRLHADVYHVPLNTVPLAMPRPYIVTVHDMSSLIYPERRAGGMHRWRYERGLRRANRVIAVSEATRRDIEDVLGIPSNRIQVIYNAPDPAFRRAERPVIASAGGESESQYPPEMEHTLNRYQINFPFLLYAGTIRPQKNIPRMIEAFSIVRQELEKNPTYHGLKLIIIGDEISRAPEVRRAVIQSRVEHAVRFLGFVPIDTLRVFYQAASVFVFPSLYEGFGLPPLEAMACGTPVVSSALSSLPEVVGDAAVIVNPENVFDIARGVREALLDETLRSTLVERGFEQVRRFDWLRTARAVVDAYHEAAARGR
jgi:glycosyltransferase involved in cell wall biosynthesis